MKNIHLSSLPTFHGLTSEDPDTFLFEYDILCCSCDYFLDAQELNIFPTTLKSGAMLQRKYSYGLG